jgi:hypothetical protein
MTRLGCAIGIALLTAATATDAAAAPPPTGGGLDLHEEICPRGASRFRCFARIRVDAGGRVVTHAGREGLSPHDLADAYKIDTTVDPGVTIAIVDAFGYSNAESDLAAYRSRYSLPPCTVASGCLTIVNQMGQTSPLPTDAPLGDDWTIESALDLDMASAACPKCKLLLVQAQSDSGDGLYIAQGAAVQLGAAVISNSWGAPESRFGDPATGNEHYFMHPNVSTFVSTGDHGYDDGGSGPDYPSTSAYVIAVGGTTLTRSTGVARGWTESAWGEGGSSCSYSIPKPSWQTNTSCTYRGTADVSAVADPMTGVAVYNARKGGWIIVGGTSAASPLVAGIYALTGHAQESPSYAYQHASAYFDVTSGSNGFCGSVLCNAGSGWDGPTGVGSPNGSVLGADVIAPVVAITSPADGAMVPAAFEVDVSASDNVGVVKVALSADGAMIAELTAAPWTFSVAAGRLSAGSHSLSARASDAAGNTGDSKSVMITVAPDPGMSGGGGGSGNGNGNGNGGGNGAASGDIMGGCTVAPRANANDLGWLLALWLALVARRLYCQRHGALDLRTQRHARWVLRPSRRDRG